MSFVLLILFSFLLFSILFLLAFAYHVLLNFLLPMLFYGGIFAKSTPEIVKKMIFLADVKTGEKAADLGSGDGRLVIAMAKAGAEAHGYEINPFLVLLARYNINKAGLADKAFIHWKNFWNEDFSGFNIIALYQISYAMKKLEIKLKKELKPGSRVVSNYFIFPACAGRSDWQHFKKEDNVYLYLKK